MKGWTGAAACTAALALLLGLSDFATCNEINGSQLDNFPSLDAGTSQADASLSLGANTLTGDSLYSDEAQTCMTVQTGMQASAREPVFASKHASRRSKLQSNGSASGFAASQTEGQSRKLKKRHVFIGLGAISIALAAALGGGFLAWRGWNKSEPTAASLIEPTSTKVEGKLATTDVVVPQDGDDSEPTTASLIKPTFVKVTGKVEGKLTTSDVVMPMESVHTHLKWGDPNNFQKQNTLVQSSFKVLPQITNHLPDLIRKYNGFNTLRICMLSKMFGLHFHQASDLFETMYTKSSDPHGQLDLEAPVRVYPVMNEIRKVYKADPTDYKGISKILIEFFSRGQCLAKDAETSKSYITVYKQVSDEETDIPSWFAAFPDSLEAAMGGKR
eukprot:GHVT01068456.1.p1 GENE.GHVT01068456.1~~GHVT01068456.1.p1  ORF type:complete len:387 (+),score=22.38 GHVT01068456.1:1633-2793(+)